MIMKEGSHFLAEALSKVFRFFRSRANGDTSLSMEFPSDRVVQATLYLKSPGRMRTTPEQTTPASSIGTVT